MSYEKMNILLSLATTQDVKIKTISDFVSFVRRMKV